MARRVDEKTGVPRKSKVFLVDDHPILRQGLSKLINDQPDLMICGEAEGPPGALEGIGRTKPDLVLLDLSLAGGDGMELCKQLQERHQGLPVLIISMHDESLYAERALRAGAMGYVMKREESKTILEAIRTVLNGELFVSESARDRMLHDFVDRKAPTEWAPMAHLTDRELEVLELLGQGRTTVQIAKQLNISPSTVETHRAHLKEKLHVQNVSELIRVAVEWTTQR